MPSENITTTPEGPSEQPKTTIGEYSNIQDFMKDGYKTLMEAIKHSNGLPQGSDWNFYNTHEKFVDIVKEDSVKILDQISKILRTNEIKGNFGIRSTEEKTELIVEGNDNILERVAINIDEMNGIRKISNAPILIQSVSAELPINGSWNRVNNATFSVTSSLTAEGNPSKKGTHIRLLTANNIIRPQKFFKDKIVNSSNLPWEPRIKDKPNSLKPLAIFLEQSERGEEFSHPYEFELERFVPSSEQLQKETPIKPLPMKDTPLVEVSEPEQLDELLKTLLNCKQFAVDLEHHSYRTYMGITCLMQISTGEKDYLVDTLALRDKLHVLNEAFTKPTILKVFHGADSDILWLQRDLSIYVVNMFDTYFAAKQLEYSGLSLAYLMQRFCNFVPNKQFQLADWRIRPLPQELKNYAREDTHYLLYIYQMLHNELLARANGKDNLLLAVYNNSTEICKKRYFRPVLREDSHMDFYRKCKRLFDNRQLYALKELYRWRDQISRDEDESLGYVLPNHMLLQIAETLPREMQGILACCNPIPPLVRSNLLELHKIVLRAKEQPLEKPILQEDTRARGTTKKMSKINVDSPLNCPHDLTNSSDFRDDLPTILGDSLESSLPTLAITKIGNEAAFPKCSVFFTPENSDDEDKRTKIQEKVQSLNFLSPFKRYRLVRPYIRAEEEKLLKEKAQETDEKSQEVTEDSRTDEERIESIREHFLSLSRKPPPSVPDFDNLEFSLVQMGGTKRKRERSPPADNFATEHPVYLPIPNDSFQENNQRKRKSSEAPDGVDPAKKKNRKKPRKARQNKHNSGATSVQESQQQQQQDSLGSFRNANQNWKNTGQDAEGTSAQETEEQQQEFWGPRGRGDHSQRGQQGRRGKRNKNRKGENRNRQPGQGENRNRQSGQGYHEGQQSNPNSARTEDSGFTAFDYSSVDFRQFQGGGGSVQKAKDFKSNHKFKSKRKGANNNKSSMSGFPQRGQGGNRGRGRRGR